MSRNLALLIVLAIPLTAHADPPDRYGTSLDSATHDLARVFISEAGWDADREHAALAWTYARRTERMHRTRGWSFGDTARAISDRTLVDPRTPRQRWLFALPPRPTRHHRWRRRLPWRVYRDRWLAALHRARSFWLGEVDDPCSGPSELWGGRVVDKGRIYCATVAYRTHALVECGDTGNAFLRVTRRDERPRNGPRADEVAACRRLTGTPVRSDV